MKITLKIVLFSLLFIGINSCSIQKRVHQPGYHVTWKNKVQINDGKADNYLSELEPEIEITTNETTEVYASADDELILEDVSSLEKASVSFFNIMEECDVLITMDGDEISCLVREIGVSEIKYKKCGFEDGPTISILRKDVFMIKYRNGEKELIRQEDERKEESKYDSYVAQNGSSNQSEKPEERISEGFGIASLVLGILGWVAYSYILGLILILALAGIFGLISLKKHDDNPNKYNGRGMAIAGAILGAAGLVITIVLFL